MASAAEMGMAKAHDGAVFVLIASAILIYPRLVNAVDVVWHSVGVGTELHNAEWRTSPWKGMSHAVRSDDWVDILDIVSDGFFRNGRLLCAAIAKQAENKDN